MTDPNASRISGMISLDTDHLAALIFAGEKPNDNHKKSLPASPRSMPLCLVLSGLICPQITVFCGMCCVEATSEILVYCHIVELLGPDFSKSLRLGVKA